MTDLPPYDPNDARDFKKRAIFEATLSQWAYHRTFRVVYGGNCAGAPPYDLIADQIMDQLEDGAEDGKGPALILTDAEGNTLIVEGGDLGSELTQEVVEECIVGVRFLGFEEVPQ